jgi:hypothetical protein
MFGPALASKVFGWAPPMVSKAYANMLLHPGNRQMLRAGVDAVSNFLAQQAATHPPTGSPDAQNTPK